MDIFKTPRTYNAEAGQIVCSRNYKQVLQLHSDGEQLGQYSFTAITCSKAGLTQLAASYRVNRVSYSGEL